MEVQSYRKPASWSQSSLRRFERGRYLHVKIHTSTGMLLQAFDPLTILLEQVQSHCSESKLFSAITLCNESAGEEHTAAVSDRGAFFAFIARGEAMQPLPRDCHMLSRFDSRRGLLRVLPSVATLKWFTGSARHSAE